jgi:AcrR family transcriptional regulator
MNMLVTVTPQSSSVKSATRGYRSPLRAERARANREAVLRSAHELFLEQGYVRTSVAEVARRAGVSADLVYKLFETKKGLLVEVLNFAVTGVTDSPPVLEQDGPRAVQAMSDQRRQLATMAPDIAGRVSRARPVDDVFRSAAEADVEIAAKRADLHETRWRTLRAVVGAIAANGPLRHGVSEDDAATTLWLLASPETHRLLVDVRGWSLDKYAAWLADSLEVLLLPPEPGSARRHSVSTGLLD